MMKKLFAIIFALLLGTGVANAAPSMGPSSSHDLDALWATAQTTYDLAQEDAVLLLESRRVAIGDAGDVATTVQRVVWIGTAAGLRAHADLRVPWNSATCTFEVTKLRTWREGRWWPDAEKLSATAIVHTLPYAVDHADDYTTMRETMLLHDGVELPCIMETEYTITERGLPGADDVFVMAQRDPAVLVELTVSAPTALAPRHEEWNGAPAPAAGASDGRDTFTWTLRPAPALRLPVTAEPASYEPTVAWWTWRDVGALQTAWSSAFGKAAVAPTAVLDSLRAATRDAAGERARLEAGGRWLGEAVRLVRHDDRWWAFAPRPAARTWDTAYGHVLDRAALWAALLREEGWVVDPLILYAPQTEPEFGPPSLARHGRLVLRVRTPEPYGSRGLTLVCDPSDFSVHGETMLLSRPLLPLTDTPVGGRGWLNPPALTVDLRLAAGDSAWTGSGQVDGLSALEFSDQVTGSAGALTSWLGELAGSLVPGAKVPAAAVTALSPLRSTARFDVTAPFVKADDEGRRTLVIGRPHGGLLDLLPPDCRLEDATRASPVLLRSSWKKEDSASQSLSVSLRLPEGAVATRPADRAVENAAGTFKLTVTEKDGWLTYDRAVTLGADAGKPENWPALRALLLEEADAANATITWRPAQKK